MFKRNFAITAILICFFVSQAVAQKETSQDVNLAKMSKEFLNPLSDIFSVQIQNNFVFLSGDFIKGNRKANFTNFQPIMPIPLGKNWNLVNRPLIPYVSLETPQFDGTYKTKQDLGDIEFIQAISPSKGLGWFNMDSAYCK